MRQQRHRQRPARVARTSAQLAQRTAIVTATVILTCAAIGAAGWWGWSRMRAADQRRATAAESARVEEMEALQRRDENQRRANAVAAPEQIASALATAIQALEQFPALESRTFFVRRAQEAFAQGRLPARPAIAIGLWGLRTAAVQRARLDGASMRTAEEEQQRLDDTLSEALVGSGMTWTGAAGAMHGR